MKKNRITIEIAHQRYELTKTPNGENCCKMCALSLYCWNLTSGEETPCTELTTNPNYHFIKLNDDKK